MITRDDCATLNFPQTEQHYTITSDDALTVAQVCRSLNLDRHTVYKWIEAGLVPGVVRIQGKVTRIPVKSVAKLIVDI